ncbi:MAG: tagatose-bisphosphate aldolase [Candidatus Vogelbacteria bacterium CG10_big_fil_rev_8_21_14_0_10_45_14]|uniref:Tagatose-bisphosphate aldolase n=1 Tax=Candidatus Vogelbacteria bacterium CG10_big_fil_rev_8_21_14_0_10_45_14 TaxID=1975042 RepID=A0A2H0RIT5_9BACT|nr:MAG: tagatose-bisphosphate aldolase [Candidatus Vogelbacteria bacterium CG10_big_fil_rev_8_21_14_0_10_45_14]
MNTLLQHLNNAKASGRAMGHFNISTIDQFWAVVRAAEKVDEVVVIGVSEGERDFLGTKEAVALVRSAREELKRPIFINADHTYTIEKVKEAIDAGFDMVIFDGGKLPVEENIAKTKECVEYARASGSNVLVEAELGYIGEGSKIRDSLPEGAALDIGELTTKEEALNFIETTGVDLFSPAIGSVHGMLRKSADPDLNITRIKEISDTIATPLVLHGASGLRNENVKDAISAGISLIHVSTELRVAWKQALKLSLQEDPDEVAGYKILKGPKLAVESVVEDKIRLFSGKTL